jgi:hypothetical protein
VRLLRRETAISKSLAFFEKRVVEKYRLNPSFVIQAAMSWSPGEFRRAGAVAAKHRQAAKKGEPTCTVFTGNNAADPNRSTCARLRGNC